MIQKITKHSIKKTLEEIRNSPIVKLHDMLVAGWKLEEAGAREKFYKDTADFIKANNLDITQVRIAIEYARKNYYGIESE